MGLYTQTSCPRVWDDATRKVFSRPTRYTASWQGLTGPHDLSCYNLDHREETRCYVKPKYEGSAISTARLRFTQGLLNTMFDETFLRQMAVSLNSGILRLEAHIPLQKRRIRDKKKSIPISHFCGVKQPKTNSSICQQMCGLTYKRLSVDSMLCVSQDSSDQ